MTPSTPPGTQAAGGDRLTLFGPLRPEAFFSIPSAITLARLAGSPRRCRKPTRTSGTSSTSSTARAFPARWPASFRWE